MTTCLENRNRRPMEWLVITFLLIFAFLFLVLLGRQRTSRMTHQRHGVTYDLFKASLGSKYREEAVKIVYETLTEMAKFPILKNDNISTDLGIDLWEFEDKFSEIVRDFNIEDIHNSKYRALLPISTAEDFVLILSNIIDDYYQQV
jgi:hypothetical protein